MGASSSTSGDGAPLTRWTNEGKIMNNWWLVPSLVALRDEFNAVSPNRDKGADGSIGDSNHTSASDHTPDEDSAILRDKDADNKDEVHALDIDSSGPWPEPGWFNRTVLGIINRERLRWLDPNDMCRLNYVIWNGKIYDKDNGFKPLFYTGKDPHTNHAHFSNRYETRAENDTSSWGVNDMAITADEFTKIAQVTASKVGADLSVKDSGIYKGVYNIVVAALGSNIPTLADAIAIKLMNQDAPISADAALIKATVTEALKDVLLHGADS